MEALALAVAALVVLGVALYRARRRTQHDLAGHVVLITGAGGGFGRQLALQLARRGCLLACVDVASKPNEETVALVLAEQKRQQTQRDAPGARAYTADLTKAEDIDSLVKQIIQDFGCVDMLVSNAGQLQGGAVWDMTEQQTDLVLDVNLRATLLLVRALLPSMRERRRGHIVAVSSISAALYARRIAVYAATKAGLSHFMGCLYHDLADQGLGQDIHVTTVEPYFMNTYHVLSHTVSMKGSWIGRTLFEFLDPREAAAQTVRAVAERRHHVTLPTYMGPLALIHRLTPLPLQTLVEGWLLPTEVRPVISYQLRHREGSAEYLHELLSKGYPLEDDPDAVCRQLAERYTVRGEALPHDFPRYAARIEAFYKARNERVPAAVRNVFGLAG